MNFMNVLDTKVGDVERPPLMPVGTYQWVVKKIAMDSIANGEWDVVDFQLQCVGPTEDVDADEVSTYGEVKGRPMRHRFMFSTTDEANFKRSLFNLRRFIEEHLRVDGAAAMDLKEALANTVNHMCLGTIQWRPDKNNPEVQYDEIGRTAPIE